MTQPDEDFAPGEHLTPEERDLEAPAADAVEQAMVVDPDEGQLDLHRGLEVADWDAMEQARIVSPGEEDYR